MIQHIKNINRISISCYDHFDVQEYNFRIVNIISGIKQVMDGKRHESSFRRASSSLIGSFKNAQSVLIGGGNKKIVNLQVANIRIYDKNDYKKQQSCQVCFIPFTKTRRQHHCRICANAVCSSCSGSSINKQRCCDVCALKYSDQDKQMTKIKILQQLKGVAIFYTQNKTQVEQQLKRTNEELASPNQLQNLQKNSDEKMAEMDKKLKELKDQRQAIEQQIKNLQQKEI